MEEHNNQHNNNTSPLQHVESQHIQQGDDQQITPQTVQRFNKICIDATQVMNQYKTQSVALKYQIAQLVSVYQKSSANTQAVPVQKIISITNQYEQGMRQANREYNHLADQLKKEQKERNQIMFQIKDCFDKLERMEVKIKEKKKRQLQQKQKLSQSNQQQSNKQLQNQTQSVVQVNEQVKQQKTQQNAQQTTSTIQNQEETKQQQ